jgi:thiosulfate dehydrogenase
VAPPLWGPRSFNIGAGMARARTAASFIRDNMPFDLPGSLTDQQAFDVAAFVVAQPRPDYPGKELDWPRGDAPPDVAYPTRAAAKQPAAGH